MLKSRKPVDLKVGDYALSDHEGHRSPRQWGLHEVAFVGAEQVVVKVYSRKVRGDAVWSLVAISKRYVRAYGAKALVARYRAACARQVAPLEQALDGAHAALFAADGKFQDAVRACYSIDARMERAA